MSEYEPTITLPAKEAIDKVFDTSQWKIVEEEVVATARWSIHYHAIVRNPEDPEGVFRSCFYSIGATERQHESPWEYEDTVEFYAVEKKQVMKEVWVSC